MGAACSCFVLLSCIRALKVNHWLNDWSDVVLKLILATFDDLPDSNIGMQL